IFGVGLMLQRLEQHSDAIAAFSRVISLRPGIAEAHYSRALSFQRLGEYAQALPDFEKALELTPDYPDAAYACGVTLKNLGKYTEAIKAFSVAISQQSGFAAAFHGRATVRRLMEDYQ